MLPGDQVWFDNPFFERGRELIRREAYRQAIRDSKSPEETAATAATFTEALIAGEEGSNVFSSETTSSPRRKFPLRLCRDSFHGASETRRLTNKCSPPRSSR